MLYRVEKPCDFPSDGCHSYSLSKEDLFDISSRLYADEMLLPVTESIEGKPGNSLLKDLTYNDYV